MSRALLLVEGMSEKGIDHHTRDLRRMHTGVFLTGHAPPTQWQIHRAATLTAPGSVLALESAAFAWEIRRFAPPIDRIVRRGSGGPEFKDGLIFHRSTSIDATTFDGIPITTAERTLADMWLRVPNDRQRRKMLREALRLRRTTIQLLRAHLDVAPRRRAPRGLTMLIARYERLQLHRCRSDAEAHAVELIDDARLDIPQINVEIAGEEADLSWPDRRLIVEIDGDQFHEDKAEDARKTAIWTHAGWRVRRAPADLVFNAPGHFTERVRHHLKGS